MTAQDRVRWDVIYQQRNGAFPPPDPLLFEYALPLALYPEPHVKRHALDLACGMGQNGLWLAAQGYIVDMMDISRVALMRARKEAEKRKCHNFNLLQVDLDTIQLEADKYDIVCVFRYLRRELFPQLVRSVKPGGRVIYETFNINHLELVPSFNPAYLLESSEILSYFPSWDVLYLDEEHATSQFVAQKPC
jgi:2-polyprenyl-3-methyl-5-hydroxy-6-metoxy-1,4-benzoquinol methylase